jgi:hypothetical protein
MPGKLDVLGHSHQLWHVAVVLAALAHYQAVLVLLQWRESSGGCAVELGAAGAGRGGGGAAAAMGMEQVWHNLSVLAHEYVGVPAPAAPAPAAPA